MYRWIDTIFKHVNRKSPILIHTPWVKNIGNCAEEIYFGLLKAKREGKRIVFLFHQHELFWKFRLAVANRELFRLESDYAVPNDGVWGLLGGWMLTLVFAAIRVLYLPWYSLKLRAKLYWLWPKIRLAESSRDSARTMPLPARAALWLPGLKSLVDVPQLWPEIRPAVPFFDSAYLMPLLGRWGLWRPDGVDAFSWEAVDAYKWKQQYHQYVPPRLAEKKHRAAEQLRVQMGVPLSDWFVCLHVRESGFHSWDTPAGPRNASIQNYVEGIRTITDAGGWIVRLGDASMTPLPPMERVIDYPHTRFKSELMDIYLISECRVYIGTNSGPFDVAALLRRPTILVNLTEWALTFPMRRGDLAITKHIFSHSRDRFLSLKEMLEEPFVCQELGPLSDEYTMFGNRPEEIQEVIEEFLSEPEGHELSGLQEAFNRGRSGQIHRWLDQGEPFWRVASDEERVIEQYRIASRADSAAGSIGRKYLEQNWIEDRMNRTSAGT